MYFNLVHCRLTCGLGVFYKKYSAQLFFFKKKSSAITWLYATYTHALFKKKKERKKKERSCSDFKNGRPMC